MNSPSVTETQQKALQQEEEALAALLARLEDHPLPAIELKLDRMRLFLERIGNPHHHLPPVVHVAGTNGKGSLLAFLHAMLAAGGYQAHRYTSPHLACFSERFIVSNEQITRPALTQALTPLLDELAECPLTYFESATALAFTLFAQARADVTLLEVGMGGRLDATNVIDASALTAITPIAIDHQAFLGDSLAAIAGEKAGILKPGVPCVVGPQEPEALAVVEQQAELLGVPLFRYGQEWQAGRDEEGRLHYHSNALDTTTPPPALPGIHQYANAATAIACLEQLSGLLPYDETAIGEGVAAAHWQGRLQHLPAEALASPLQTHHQLVIDGAHNIAAMQAVTHWMREVSLPVHAIMAMRRDKDVQAVVSALVPHAASVTMVPIPGDRQSVQPDELAAVAVAAGAEATTAAHWQQALQHLTVTVPQKAIILVTGSLYLIGDVLHVMTSPQQGR